MHTPSPWIAIIISIASALAAAYGVLTARQSYRLSYRQELRRQPQFDLRLADFYILIPDQGRVVYAFDIVLANKSDAPNALRRVFLTIRHQVEERIPSSFVLDHDSSVTIDPPPTQPWVVVSIPSEIGPRSVLSMKALFQLPRAMLRGLEIASYTLSVEDSHSHQVSQEAIFLTERKHG